MNSFTGSFVLHAVATVTLLIKQKFSTLATVNMTSSANMMPQNVKSFEEFDLVKINT